MTTKKTRFTINHERSSRQRDEVDALIEELKSSTPATLSDEHYELLSDLSRPASDRLAERWMEIDYPVRLGIVQEMVRRFETDIEHHYDRALTAALADTESDVKLLAFEGLTDSNDQGLLAYLITRLPQEEDGAVRAAGAKIFGQFVLESELNRLPGDESDSVRDTVVSMASRDTDRRVRLQSLESAAFLSDNDVIVRLIDDAWRSGSHDAQVSALRAMGRQCDPRWMETVVNEFASDEPEVRFEAARAAGNLGGQRIVPQLIDLTEDDDVEVQMAAIAALGAIGGDIAVTALRNLEHSESVAIADAASAALEEAVLADSATRPPNSLW
ncbi:MAG TPA: HEAT repeat domain-containing protein [Thermomicrobiales bacterium]|nr:HEAT repeat domain-containing protein [Thermomicrobiales bacterium]